MNPVHIIRCYYFYDQLKIFCLSKHRWLKHPLPFRYFDQNSVLKISHPFHAIHLSSSHDPFYWINGNKVTICLCLQICTAQRRSMVSWNTGVGMILRCRCVASFTLRLLCTREQSAWCPGGSTLAVRKIRVYTLAPAWNWNQTAWSSSPKLSR